MRRGRRGALRASGLQERLLPTLNAVLMPATTGLPPRLQRRTCSRNRFSFLLYDGDGSLGRSLVVSPSRSSPSVFAPLPQTVFSTVSLSLSYPHSPSLSFSRSLFFALASPLFSLSRLRVLLISLSCLLSCTSTLLSLFRSLSQMLYPPSPLFLSLCHVIILVLFVSCFLPRSLSLSFFFAWLFYNLSFFSYVYFCTHIRPP